MAKVPNDIETLPKISIAWVGCTNVTDDRRQTTDRKTDGRRHIANVNMSSRSLKTFIMTGQPSGWRGQILFRGGGQGPLPSPHWRRRLCIRLLSLWVVCVGRPEPRIVVIATMGYLDEFWFSVVLGVSRRDDHFCQRNPGRISFGFWDICQNVFSNRHFILAISPVIGIIDSCGKDH